MEYYDIVFEGLSSDRIDSFISNELNINKTNIINSHFHSPYCGALEFNENIVLKELFSYPNTGNMHIAFLQLDKQYTDIMLIISSDENDIEITLNIEQTQFTDSDFNNIKAVFKRIKTRYNLKSIYLGDDNTKKEYAILTI